MTKDTALYVVRQIEGSLVSPLRRGCQLSAMHQFLSVLRFYCTGSFQLVIGDLVTMNQATICRLVRRVSIAIARLRPKYIRLLTHAEAPRIREQFFPISGFPGNLIVKYTASTT